MTKKIKIVFLILFILLFISSFSYATDINMNTTINDSIVSRENTMTSGGNISTNTLRSNFSAASTPEISDAATTISSVNQNSSDDGLGLTNILNILLIVVGVVIILLAIAILIRLFA